MRADSHHEPDHDSDGHCIANADHNCDAVPKLHRDGVAKCNTDGAYASNANRDVHGFTNTHGLAVAD